MVSTGSVRVILRSSFSSVSTFTVMLLILMKIAGARGGTRTPTPLLASGPKPGASTNFATRAGHWKGKADGQETPDRPLESGQHEILTAFAARIPAPAR